MKQRIIDLLLAILVTNALLAGILLDSVAKQESEEAYVQPTVTPTPTPDTERIQLRVENERLRQKVKTLEVFKSDFEGLVEAQIRRR